MSGDLTALDAHALAHEIGARQVSCREVMQAYLARIDGLNPQFNAIVARAPADLLLRQADERDAELARGTARGFLHGFPVAIKDTAAAAGFTTTRGSPLLADAVAAADGLVAARMKAAGAIVIGKTNVPEFGLGSHTFNDVYGVTGNAWDPSRSAGGSSGGAAVALAQRLLPIADGSDFMGSLRNPAGWNNVFGLRPSQGRVPMWPAADVWMAQLATEGPMARTVRDLAALLGILAGRDDRVPLSIAGPVPDFVPAPDVSLRGARIGWLGDLGGYLPFEPGILPACEAALARCAAAGAVVEPVALGFAPAAVWEAWLVWRQALVASAIAPLLAMPGARQRIKPEAQWEHDRAQGLAARELMRASALRTTFHTHLLGLFGRFDALVLPVAQVWPFDAAERWPREVAGRTMDTYHRWMEVTIHATFAGLPAIAVPAGFDAAGRLPTGLQWIGPPQGDAALLRLAAAYEALIGDWLERRPPEPA